MHDIGLMVEIQFDRAKLIECIEKCAADENGEPAVGLLEVEAELFGATHQDFGAALCEKWKFPQPFVTAAGFHHNPAAVTAENRTLVSVIHLADRLAAQAVGAFRLDLPNLELPAELCEQLKLTKTRIDEIRDQVVAAVSNIEA